MQLGKFELGMTTMNLHISRGHSPKIYDLLGRQYLMGMKFELEWGTLIVKWEFGSLPILLEKQFHRIPTHKIGLDLEEIKLIVLPRLSIQLEQLPILIRVQGWPTHFCTHFQLIEIRKFIYGRFNTQPLTHNLESGQKSPAVQMKLNRGKHSSNTTSHT